MGILNSLLDVLGGSANAPQSDKILLAAYGKSAVANSWWHADPQKSEVYLQEVVKATDDEKITFMVEWIARISNFFAGHVVASSNQKEFVLTTIAQSFLRQLLSAKINWNEARLTAVAQAFLQYRRGTKHMPITEWPLGILLTQFGKWGKKNSYSQSMTNLLLRLQAVIKSEPDAGQQGHARLSAKIDSLLFKESAASGKVQPVFFKGQDAFAARANADIRNMNPEIAAAWYPLLAHAQNNNGSKPNKKFIATSHALIATIGIAEFEAQMNQWLEFLSALKDTTREIREVHGERSFVYTTTEYLSSPNIDAIRGLVWCCQLTTSATTLLQLAKLAERSFRKIPNKGPAAMLIGNACLYALSCAQGLEGVSHLSRLRIRIKQASTQNLIDRYLRAAAEQQGLTLHEIEDMAVDDFGLVEGRREFMLEGYRAIVEIAGIGKTNLRWYKPDESPQKAVPNLIKEKHGSELKKINELVKQVTLTVSTQRDRLDQQMKYNRRLTGPAFTTYYLTHGLMSFLADRIIWMIERGGVTHTVIRWNGNWVNAQGEAVPALIDEATTVTLWHPVFASVTDVETWRNYMLRNAIVQPLKQAYREVYFLTDAEINTFTYSNRMAAHILKQHQFNQLAKARNWRYSLMGNFDNGGINQLAYFELKEYNLRAEFWVNEVNADGAQNDTGIWTYISTDQVRFTDLRNMQVKELGDIPALLFSEIMRDTDLFVGVASVGNDPNWRDNGGLNHYHDYWQSFSFGDLNETAKTRKQILVNLLPRLKIAPVASVSDKFVVVKGKLRTYKIHMGSTNILMEPNDEYLCIVPDRSKADHTQNIFLPFEGDSGLSVILSKAMLLADDDKITDPTIVRQIKRN